MALYMVGSLNLLLGWHQRRYVWKLHGTRSPAPSSVDFILRFCCRLRRLFFTHSRWMLRFEMFERFERCALYYLMSF